MKQQKFSVVAMLIVLLAFTIDAAAQSWIELSPVGTPPTPRGFHGASAVYDPSSNRMIVFGGRDPSNVNNNDVWILTNANGLTGTSGWINLLPANGPGTPLPRSGHSAVYDPSSNRMIVFGGCNGFCLPALNDVWVLTNANGIGGPPAWIQLSPGGAIPFPRTKHTAVYDPNSNSMIVFAGQDGGGFGCSTFSAVSVLSNANGLEGPAMWTELTTSGGPPAGQYAPTAVYDSTTNRMIVFGGAGFVAGSCTLSNAVWALQNANGDGGPAMWTNLVSEGAPGAPAPRNFHSASYDQLTNEMPIFGGSTITEGFTNDVWTLVDANGTGNSTAWKQIVTSGGPPAPRNSQTSVLDFAADRIILFGGDVGVDLFANDVWILAIGKTNQPPVAVITGVPNAPLECTGPVGAQITLDGSGSHDPDGDTAFTYLWKLDGSQVGTGKMIALTVSLGTHNVSLTVTDADGLSSTAQATVTVRDTTPPSLSVSLSPNVLWPPNHKLVPITANIAAGDTCDPNPKIALVSIVANEPIDSNDIQGAIFGTDDRTFSLAANRLGSGIGRVYTVTYSVTDASGNSAIATAQVVVPHDQGN